jgi:uncharacterized protein
MGASACNRVGVVVEFLRDCIGQASEAEDRSMISAVSCPYFRRAFGWCVPIGGLGGLIGFGGGEFRLPVLMYGIGFNARSAVPLNLLTSLVTLTFALAIRSGAVSLGAVVPYLPEMAGVVAGGMVSAFYGAQLGPVFS